LQRFERPAQAQERVEPVECGFRFFFLAIQCPFELARREWLDGRERLRQHTDVAVATIASERTMSPIR
jgi:hypothetical protein